MVNIIHYEDDIFFLTYTIKKLADGMRLELDPSLFRSMVVEEISFISRTIEFFLESLKSNKLKVNRLNYLKGIYKVNKLLIELLNKILTDQVPFAAHLKEQTDRFTVLRDHHIEYEDQLKDALHPGGVGLSGDQEAMSEEEYRILMAQSEEN